MPTPEEGTPELDVQTPADWQQEQQEQIDWEKRYKDLQAEFTKKTQEKPTHQQPNQEQEQEPITEQHYKRRIKDLWFISREELESEKHFNGILESNPDLKTHANAIKKLAEAENLAYEDVIEKYWFSTKDKLSKAKERGLIGEKDFGNKSKSIENMTDAEYEEWRKINIKKWASFEPAQSF